MIRILHTIDTTGPGGAETVFVNLVKGLNRQEFESTVVIRGTGWVCDELAKNGITPLFINSRGSFNLKYLFSLVRVIRQKKINVVQSHLLGSNLYCSLAGILTGVHVVSTFHGFVDMHDKERFASIKSWLINHGSSRLVFVSEKLKNYYVTHKGFSLKKSVTICNGVDTSRFKPQPNKSIREKFGLGPANVLVGSVGNIRPAKGYNYLLEAAKLVVNKYPQFRFVVAGEGSGKLFEDLLALRKDLELENHFFFLGFEPDVSGFMNNLDIFVLPSVSEGFSISTIEAMACGVPIIATRCGGPEEILRHLDNGVLVDTRCSSELSVSIMKLYEDEELKKKNIFNGIMDVRMKYSNEIVKKCYTDMYKNI